MRGLGRLTVRWSAVVLGAFVLPAAAQEGLAGGRTVQSAAVLAHYPPLALRLETPALHPGRTTPTTQAELESFVTTLAEALDTGGRIAVTTLGITPGKRKVLALLFSREGVKTPAEIAKLGRPVVWLIGQQHGNEPAGGEATLAVAKALAAGELTDLLDHLSIIVIPRANPDGAAAARRENAAGFDINRDHGLLTQPESQFIHTLAREAPPALVVDAHEFIVVQHWLEKLGGLQSIDLMVLSATHPMVAAPVRALADDVFQPAIDAAMATWGLSSFVYHTSSVRAGDRTLSVGGNAPGIARNTFGLLGAVSFLLETRGVGIGFDSFQRRVATHYVAIRALLQAAATHADQLQRTVVAARADESRPDRDVIIAATVGRKTVRLPLIDPTSGEARAATLDLLDTREVTGTERRVRPEGYVVGPHRAAWMVQKLSQMGAQACLLGAPVDSAIERYEILARNAPDRRAINPGQSLVVRLHADHASLAAGSLWVPLDQPMSTMLALTLEPDAPGSLSAMDLVKEDGSGLDIVRVPRGDGAADQGWCRR